MKITQPRGLRIASVTSEGIELEPSEPKVAIALLSLESRHCCCSLDLPGVQRTDPVSKACFASALLLDSSVDCCSAASTKSEA